MDIAKLLIELQESENLTQTQIGEKLGVGQTTIGRWLRGEKTPSYENLRRIAITFKLSADEILDVADVEITPTTQLPQRAAVTVTQEERILLDKLRKIPPALQDQAFDYLDAFLDTTIKRYHLTEEEDKQA